MPYIKKERRKEMEKTLIELARLISDEGELNYAITKLCLEWEKKFELRYSTLNKIIGVLSCVLQEFYRREVVPYEDKKRRENGDVYERR